VKNEEDLESARLETRVDPILKLGNPDRKLLEKPRDDFCKFESHARLHCVDVHEEEQVDIQDHISTGLF
jgi:hypothetical protein